VQLAVADVNERGDRAAQVQQRVQLDGGLGRAKRRPVEQAQAPMALPLGERSSMSLLLFA
jgi:hypothetical protein